MSDSHKDHRSRKVYQKLEDYRDFRERQGYALPGDASLCQRSRGRRGLRFLPPPFRQTHRVFLQAVQCDRLREVHVRRAQRPRAHLD